MNKNNEDSSEKFRELSSEAIYGTLRNEVISRIDIRYQLTNYTIVAFGVLISLGLNQDTLAGISLVYPLVSMGFLFAWIDNHNRLKLITNYLRKHKSDWEIAVAHHRSVTPYFSRERIGAISTGFIFIGTQIIALWLDFSQHSNSIHISIYMLAGIPIIISIFMLGMNYGDIEIKLPRES